MNLRGHWIHHFALSSTNKTKQIYSPDIIKYGNHLCLSQFPSPLLTQTSIPEFYLCYLLNIWVNSHLPTTLVQICHLLIVPFWRSLRWTTFIHADLFCYSVQHSGDSCLFECKFHQIIPILTSRLTFFKVFFFWWI